jgi:hypothetical protein
MIRLRGTIEYEGGRTETFETGSAALAEWELYAMRHGYPIAQGQAPPMLSALVIAHHALGVDEGFDVWRKSVIGVELETEGVPPTLPVAIDA